MGSNWRYNPNRKRYRNVWMYILEYCLHTCYSPETRSDKGLDCYGIVMLTHWGRATHICVSKLTSIGSDNGLSPGRRQAIIWTNTGILLIGTLGINFSEILSEIHTFSFKKIRLKTSSAKWRPFCLGLNELKCIPLNEIISNMPPEWFIIKPPTIQNPR